MNPSADAAEVQAKIRSDGKGKEKEFEKKGEAIATQAGQKLDKAVRTFTPPNTSPYLTSRQQVDEARGKLSEAQLKAKEYKDRTGKELHHAVDSFDSTVEKKAAEARAYKERTGKDFNDAVDKFDKTVERKATEAKSGISSWFGFGGK